MEEVGGVRRSVQGSDITLLGLGQKIILRSCPLLLAIGKSSSVTSSHVSRRQRSSALPVGDVRPHGGARPDGDRHSGEAWPASTTSVLCTGRS